MNKTLELLVGELDQLASQLDSGIPNAAPFNVAHNNWSFPGVSKLDLINWVKVLAEEITEKGPLDLGDDEPALAAYVKSLKHLRDNAVPNIWGNPAAGVSVLQQTLDGLRIAFRQTLPTEPPEDAAKSIKRLTARLSAMQARVDSLEPKAGDLEAMVSRIEAANAAADALPEDLKSLEDARKKVAAALERANTDASLTAQAKDAAKSSSDSLAESAAGARQVLDKCESAYSAATSQGLARAFSRRSTSLSWSMWFWAFALAAALGAGVKFGGDQLSQLAEAIKTGASGFTLGAALVLAVLKLGGPIWFAWLSTKQVGQRFRLAEDYAYKASISSAYEGYRKEAARIDAEMEQRLLASALDRLDEQPLRLVEQHTHGSPWQELLSSDQVRKAVAKGPEFVRLVKDAAADFLRGPGAERPRDASPRGAKPVDE